MSCMSCMMTDTFWGEQGMLNEPAAVTRNVLMDLTAPPPLGGGVPYNLKLQLDEYDRIVPV